MDLTSPLDVAIARWPELHELRHLDGWHWQSDGPTGLVGEQWLGGPWLNALIVNAPADAFAARMRVLDDTGEEHELVWLAEGTVAAVLGQLSLVPLPGHPGAPTEPRPLVVLPVGTDEQPWMSDR